MVALEQNAGAEEKSRSAQEALAVMMQLQKMAFM